MQLKKLNEKQKKELLEKRTKLMAKKMDTMIGKYLGMCMEKDLCFGTDPAYISARTLALLQAMTEKVNPYSEEIYELRKKLLAKTIEWARGSIPKPEKFDAVDATGAQKKRCEPVAIEILRMLLKPEFVEDDKTFIEHVALEDDISLFATFIDQYTESLFTKFEFAVSVAISKANRTLWDGKELNERTFQNLNRIASDCDKPKK